MKRKIVLLLFIFLVSINWSNAVELKENSDKSNRTVKIQNTGIKEKKKDKEKEKYKIIIDNKNKLKKEIRQRRVYHKNLLYLYNKDFENKHLDLITHNWLIINNLEKHLKKVSI